MYLVASHEGRVRTQASADFRIARGWCAQPSDYLWIDVEAPTTEELAFLQTTFNLHPLAVEECDHAGVRPKIEQYPGHLYLVVHGMNHNPGAQALDTVEFKFFLMRGRLITIHNEPSSSIRHTQERLKRDPQFIAKGVDNILHSIVDAVVDHYFPVLQAMEDRLETHEAAIFTHPDQSILEDILALRRESLKLQRLMQPQLDILGALSSGRYAEVDPSDVAYFHDVYDHLLRINDRVHILREGLSGAMECYLSQNSNRTNDIMKTLTVAATMLLPVSVLTNLLGTTYEHLPGKQNAIWWVLALSLASLVGTYYLLRRARWL